MNPSSEPITTAGMRITNTRVFAAPREVLFDLFADPEQLEHWWGPEGFTNTFEQFDFEPGGAWRFTMHGPDGTDYPNAKDFVEIVRPERIVLDHIQQQGHLFRLTMTYQAEGEGNTRLTWQMDFTTANDDELRAFITTANEQNFDRLAEQVTKVMP